MATSVQEILMGGNGLENHPHLYLLFLRMVPLNMVQD